MEEKTHHLGNRCFRSQIISPHFNFLIYMTFLLVLSKWNELRYLLPLLQMLRNNSCSLEARVKSANYKYLYFEKNVFYAAYVVSCALSKLFICERLQFLLEKLMWGETLLYSELEKMVDEKINKFPNKN